MNRKEEKILDATIALFLRDGVRKISMDEIAEAAVASKVTVYKYFSDKDTLFAAVAGRIFACAAEQIESMAACGESLSWKLYAFMDCVAGFADSGRLGLGRDLARRNGAAADHYAQYRQAYRSALEALIGDGIAGGMFRSDLSREMIFYYIDMGVSYYQTYPEYRSRMRGDAEFRRAFMRFHIGNVFLDAETAFAGGNKK